MSDIYWIYYSPGRVYVENQRDERVYSRFFRTRDPIAGPGAVLSMRKCIRNLAKDYKVPVDRIQAVGQTAIMLIGLPYEILGGSSDA